MILARRHVVERKSERKRRILGAKRSQVLSIFSFYKINLTKIQSLPIIGREWEYLFYVDVIFNDYLRYKQSIDAVSPLTKELKILGEYAEGTSTI